MADRCGRWRVLRPGNRRSPAVSIPAPSAGPLRIWPLAETVSPAIVAMPVPLNAVTIGSDGQILTGGADGTLYMLSRGGARIGEVAAGPRPVISIAISADGALAAAAGIGGSV